MRKKMITGLLAMVMTLSLIGCGGKTGGDSVSDGGNSVSGGMDGEPYTVTMVLCGTQQADEERIEGKINEILEKELNARLDLMVLPWSSSHQQIQLMLSGDEKIDVFYTSATNAVQYMHSGQVLDMAPLIDQYGKNLKEVFGEEALKGNSVDGFLYGVPTQIERGSIPAVFLRKDMVEKYNIDTSVIKEPKDLESVFETVQAGEPDMTMLFSIGGVNSPLNRMFRGDYLSDGNFLGVLMDPENDTTIENYYASDWYRDSVTMLYDWYKKGYISQDAGTNSEGWSTMLKAGNTFSMIFSYHPGTPVEFESSTGYAFEIIPFGEYPVKMSSSYNATIFAMARNSENPDKAMEVLDYIYGSPELMNLLNWGEQDMDYVMVDEENDIIDYPEGITKDTVGYSLNLGWMLPNQFIAHKWNGSDPQLWEKMEAFNESAKDSKALGFYFDDSQYENQIAALANVVQQYTGTLSSGSADPDVYIPEFLGALEEAGIDEIIAAKQEQFDNWLAEK